jgi:hypothetical protein
MHKWIVIIVIIIIIIIIIPNKYMEQRASWNTISCTAGNERPYILHNFSYHRQKNLLVVRIQCQRNPIHSSHCYCKVNYDIFVRYTPRTLKNASKGQVVSLSVTLWRPCIVNYNVSIHSTTDCRCPDHRQYSLLPLYPLRSQRNVPLCTVLKTLLAV